jgi:hypothetical protein
LEALAADRDCIVNISVRHTRPEEIARQSESGDRYLRAAARQNYQVFDAVDGTGAGDGFSILDF